MTNLRISVNGKSKTAKAWTIETAAVVAGFKAGQYKSSRDLGLALLADKESLAALEASCTKGDDIPGGNWSLRAFEQALDWTLGAAAVNFIQQLAKIGKRARTFEVAVDRRGSAYIIMPSGRVYDKEFNIVGFKMRPVGWWKDAQKETQQ